MVFFLILVSFFAFCNAAHWNFPLQFLAEGCIFIPKHFVFNTAFLYFVFNTAFLSATLTFAKQLFGIPLLNFWLKGTLFTQKILLPSLHFCQQHSLL